MKLRSGKSGWWWLGWGAILMALASGQAFGQAATNPPTILYSRAPQSLVVSTGATASLSAIATGSTPMRYQWRKNGTNLDYATSYSLHFSKVTPADEGDFTAVASNDAGSVTSVVARITVIPPPGALRARVLTNGSPPLPYRLFVPTNPTPDGLYPLVLFMHGSGERGNDNLRQLSVNPEALAFVSYSHQESHPAFFVAPQCPSDRFWSDGVMLPRLGDLLAALAEEYPIDINRLYITGLSMGGYGCWYLLDAAPDVFAAAVPICGGGYAAGSYRYAHVPIWNFHAANDGVVPIAESRNMVSALRANGSRLLHTEYASGDHGIWGRAYATPGLVEWTFGQTRGVPLAGLVVVDQATNLASRTVGAGLLRLSGAAGTDGRTINSVAWTNLANRARGTAAGSNEWRIAAVPLVSQTTNLILVTATGLSLAPAVGGTTTFSERLAVTTGPPLRLVVAHSGTGIRVSASAQTTLILQTSTNLASAAWEETQLSPLGPVELPATDPVRFFRLLDGVQ